MICLFPKENETENQIINMQNCTCILEDVWWNYLGIEFVLRNKLNQWRKFPRRIIFYLGNIKTKKTYWEESRYDRWRKIGKNFKRLVWNGLFLSNNDWNHKQDQEWSWVLASHKFVAINGHEEETIYKWVWNDDSTLKKLKSPLELNVLFLHSPKVLTVS